MSKLKVSKSRIENSSIITDSFNAQPESSSRKKSFWNNPWIIGFGVTVVGAVIAKLIMDLMFF